MLLPLLPLLPDELYVDMDWPEFLVALPNLEPSPDPGLNPDPVPVEDGVDLESMMQKFQG